MKKHLLIILTGLCFLSCSHEVSPGQIAAGPQPIDPDAVITGTVSLKEGLSPSGTGVLFIIARPKGEVAGPPLAVKRLEDPVLPINFTMSQANVMIQGNRFAGEITLSAKWSKDGTPMGVSPGDLSVKEPLNVSVGTRDIKIVLDHQAE